MELMLFVCLAIAIAICLLGTVHMLQYGKDCKLETLRQMAQKYHCKSRAIREARLFLTEGRSNGLWIREEIISVLNSMHTMKLTNEERKAVKWAIRRLL